MRRFISILLCIVMLFSLCTVAFAEQPEYETITGEYSYSPSLSMLSKEDQTWTFTYSDGYFANSGYQFNKELAIMTMDMAQSAFSSAESTTTGWHISNRNFGDLMVKCGFTNIDANEFAASRPNANSIGVNAASKEISVNGHDYTLIALGLRGHNYKGEWGSNFNMGASGDHAGFAGAAEKTIAYLKDYIAKYNISGDVKIWITGYSRSAIAANMTGGILDRGVELGENVSFSPKDLYCYTFEAPQGTADENCRDKVYRNIHNILNANDLVPHVSFTAWGHSRFGVDYYLPCRQYDPEYASLKTSVDAVLEKMGWMKLLGFTLDIVDDFHYISLNPATAMAKRNVTQIEFYPDVIDALFDTIAPSRQYYVDNLQADMMELSSTLFGLETDLLMNGLAIFGQKITSPENVNLIFNGLASGCISDKSAGDIIVDIFMEALKEAGCVGYNGDQVRVMVQKLIPNLVKLITEHTDTMLTLLGNIIQILNAHFPEMGHAWLSITPEKFFLEQNPDYVQPDFYSDVAPDSYCYDAVKWASEEGITNGITETLFAPNQACTRAQAATFLWRAAGSPEPETDNCRFTDVSSASVYYKAILWAAENGITKGIDGTHFDPNAVCTRAQIVTFIYRYEGSPLSIAVCPFVDVSIMSPYYRAIAWAYKSGITTGTDAYHFSPNAQCTRGHIITFLYRDLI